MNLSNTSRFILECASPMCSSNILNELLHDIDWEILLEISRKTRTSPIVFFRIREFDLKSDVPEKIYIILQNYYFKNLSKNTLIYSAFDTIIGELNKNSIVPILLKGIYLAKNIYNNIGIRQLSDIDILLEEEHIESAVNVILSLGYEFEIQGKSEFINQNKDVKHLPMLHKKGIGVELHKKVVHSEKEYTIPEQSFFSDLQVLQNNNFQTRLFSNENFLISLCLHIDEHVLNAKMHFIGYIDVAWFLQHTSNLFSWEKLIQTCSKYSIEDNVYAHLFITHKYFAAPIPVEIITHIIPFQNDYYESYFINSIQPQGNFSVRKRNQNINEIKRVKGFSAKVKFLIHDLFPSKKFMIMRYNIKNHKLYYLYYPIRVAGGIKSLFKYVLKINQN